MDIYAYKMVKYGCLSFRIKMTDAYFQPYINIFFDRHYDKHDINIYHFPFVNNTSDFTVQTYLFRLANPRKKIG